MSEIEQAYKEGFRAAFNAVWPTRDIEIFWQASQARKTEDEWAAQRKIVREASEKLEAELNR